MAEKCEVILKGAAPKTVTPVHKMFRAVEGGLGYQYHANWGHVLDILTVYFEVAGKECQSIMKKVILTLKVTLLFKIIHLVITMWT